MFLQIASKEEGKIKKLICGIILLLLAIRCVGEESVNDDGPQQSTTGPVPPPEVIERDARRAQELAILGESEYVILSENTIPSVPAYIWRHGCGPTAVGMVVGYYDSFDDFNDLIPGDAPTQTVDVNQAIASGGKIGDPYPPGFEEHFEDYSIPIDPPPGPRLDDDYIGKRPPHADNCIADYMHTSKSTMGNRYGWSWSNDLGPALVSYVNLRSPRYNAGYQFYHESNAPVINWSVLTNEIDNGRPMTFLVDTNGDDHTDHFVTVVGYRDVPTQQYGCLDTWGTPIRWEDFVMMANGVPWGVYGGWAMDVWLRSSEINIRQDETDIPNGGSYDFGRVNIGWDKPIIFTIENLGDANLPLTGSPLVEISGTDAAEFVVTEEPSTAILGEGESVTFEITFTPAGTGAHSAMVSIDNNDVDENPYTFSLTGTGSIAQTIYVDADATGSNNGSSWSNAYNYLQDGLDVFVTGSNGGDEILVAEGTYRPDDGAGVASGDRMATFGLINGLVIKGGYAGVDEPDPNVRDADAYVTILSGDLDSNDVGDLDDPSRCENSYHIATVSETNVTAELDGFIITGGNADGTYPESCGGGIYDVNGSPNITNCTIIENSADYLGGGIYIYNSSTTLTDCTFRGNSATSYGGGMCSEIASLTLTNCIFRENRTDYMGGGICNYSESDPTMVNCIFIGNSADFGGGIYSRDNTSSPTLTNCTFGGNTAGSYGGGMNNSRGSIATVTSSILWGNEDSSGTGESAQISGINPVVNYCCVEGLTGGLGGTDNIDLDPCFVAPDSNDYHLQWDSPCINAGDPGLVADANERDIDDEPRVMDSRVDMGADEVGPKQADFTRNGIINFEDYVIFSQAWSTTEVDERWYILCDLYENGFIGFLDLGMLSDDWLWQAIWYEP